MKLNDKVQHSIIKDNIFAVMEEIQDCALRVLYGPRHESFQVFVRDIFAGIPQQVLIQHTLSEMDGQLSMDAAPVLPPTCPLFRNIQIKADGNVFAVAKILIQFSLQTVLHEFGNGFLEQVLDVVHAKMTERLFRKADLWYTGVTGESKIKVKYWHCFRDFGCRGFLFGGIMVQ